MLKRFRGSIIAQKFNSRALCCISIAHVSAAAEQLRQGDGWVDLDCLETPLEGQPSGTSPQVWRMTLWGKLLGIFSGEVLNYA